MLLDPNNHLLDSLESYGVVLHIGSVYCGAPRVADGLLFLSRTVAVFPIQVVTG